MGKSNKMDNDANNKELKQQYISFARYNRLPSGMWSILYFYN